ncbi:ATP-binding protein [Parabacteroides sp. TM07-1AC]|jgi:predicted AAA+ superfamily ATPase|uniref:ATP-binding protein n=1 Tax=Parabacteroides sp. TM07-1AC TaxID=2292363 RepID=UPI000EFE3EA3|nr:MULTISPECIES: ATP-binding protein [Parabacteroides]RHU25645.1 ATP-binding protein [Parabacteroides sp. TM07-1AC]
MLRQEQIAEVIDAQQVDFLKIDDKLPREALSQIPIVDNFATIITGVRRCGKSTILLQLLNQKYKKSIYCNFEDIRLVSFDTSDFVRLHAEIKKREVDVLFFDEIQLAKGWDVFVHQLLRESFKVFITGSNASLLSKELGTHLTGRHIPMELFPFSYNEFLEYKKLEASEDSMKQYLSIGGVPEYVKTDMQMILTTMMDDILVRDIAIRQSIRDVSSLKQLALYLLSNIGKPVAANKLTGLFGVKAPSTILEYFSYLSDAYLVEFVPQFSYSLKTQSRNPKKVYAIDTGLVTALSMSFTDDFGRRLENLVYLHLRRKYKEIFFFANKGECDFVVFDRSTIKLAVQVCYHIDDLNFERELNGLTEAMTTLHLSEGIIVTMSQSDSFEKDGKRIKMIPAYHFLRTEIE